MYANRYKHTIVILQFKEINLWRADISIWMQADESHPKTDSIASTACIFMTLCGFWLATKWQSQNHISSHIEMMHKIAGKGAIVWKYLFIKKKKEEILLIYTFHRKMQISSSNYHYQLVIVANFLIVFFLPHFWKTYYDNYLAIFEK